MEKQTRSIVVFDSGIGGLNLLSECIRRVPNADYYYVSDSDNMPYGNKSKQEITALTLKALEVVDKIKPCALVLACNTVTANCVDVLRKKFPFPVIGVQPAIKSAAQASDNCLILATNATVGSPAFAKLINSYNMSCACALGCDGLAQYVEENIFALPDILPDGLLPDVNADCVVLGCTHYTFVKKQIAAKYGCAVIDGIGATADHFTKILGTADHFTPLLGKISHFGKKTVNLTFLGGNIEKNSQIFKQINKNKRLIMSSNFKKIKNS